MREVTQYSAPPHRMQLAQPRNALHLHINEVAIATYARSQRMSGFWYNPCYSPDSGTACPPDAVRGRTLPALLAAGRGL